MGKVKGEAGAQAGMIWVALLPESDTETFTFISKDTDMSVLWKNVKIKCTRYILCYMCKLTVISSEGKVIMRLKIKNIQQFYHFLCSRFCPWHSLSTVQVQFNYSICYQEFGFLNKQCSKIIQGKNNLTVRLGFWTALGLMLFTYVKVG